MQKHFISFCTVCMNRLHHLKQTLPKNLKDNEKYSTLEFVLLDYNSSDGLEEWVKAEMYDYIEKKRLVYYKTKEPLYFHRSHSRNMVFRLAQGEIVGNIDADNFTGYNFAFYLNRKLQDENIFLSARNSPHKDMLGRFCAKKEDFLKIGGYDESMQSYGFEDLDLLNRLAFLGREEKKIDKTIFFRHIKHTDIERISNEFNFRLLYRLFISYIDPSMTTLLFLFKNKTFNKGILIDNHALKNDILTMAKDKPEYEYTIQSEEWEKGTWSLGNKKLSLHENNKSTIELQLEKTSHIPRLVYENKSFYEVIDIRMLQEIMMFHSQISNRFKMSQNLRNHNINVNQNAFGKGEVYRNFDYQNPIYLQ